jgi:hypothetical protein
MTPLRAGESLDVVVAFVEGGNGMNSCRCLGFGMPIVSLFERDLEASGFGSDNSLSDHESLLVISKNRKLHLMKGIDERKKKHLPLLGFRDDEGAIMTDCRTIDTIRNIKKIGSPSSSHFHLPPA